MEHQAHRLTFGGNNSRLRRQNTEITLCSHLSYLYIHCSREINLLTHNLHRTIKTDGIEVNIESRGKIGYDGEQRKIIRSTAKSDRCRAYLEKRASGCILEVGRFAITSELYFNTVI